MPYIEIYKDAYPEQLLAAMRDELRREERVEAARAEAAERRRARRAAARERLRPWLLR